MIFVCSKCDAQYPKWQGRCTECGSWGTISEEVDTKLRSKNNINKLALSEKKLVSLSQVSSSAQNRLTLGLSEIDKVLGGGLVSGSLVLLGGQPGIGKSTLVLQIADSLASMKRTVFYFSGEESAEQIKLRAERLGLKLSTMKISLESNLDVIISTLVKHKPFLVVIDSIQTVWTAEADGTAGGVSQVRAATTKLLETAKKYGITIIIIGHVTKDGSVAGPKTLEHLVDTVLYLEGERLESIRLIRVVKNRFGPSGEVGVLVMGSRGLEPVKNSGKIFLSSRQPSPGSSIGAVLEGSRVFLTSVDALLEKSTNPYPKRTVIGFDNTRLQVLLAILNKHAGINLSGFDVYVHLPGGLKTSNPSLDLAVCLALVSAKSGKALNSDTLFVGEVSLNGSLRPVLGQAKIIQEAANLGLARVLIPKGQKKIISRKVKIEEYSDIKNVVRKILK